MADLKNWPWALNQPGYDYPAEYIRSEHNSATSGGNGVSSPTAMKVEAQTAPDGTVRIRPGGASVVSTYAGQEGQSYYSPEFQSKTLTVPPTGSSSGGRTDLIVRRVLDPDHEAHPEHSGEMTEEAAQDLDFQWYELIQGATASTSLSYPHVKLAEIRRPANTTIVNTSHIVDVRVLADPQSDRDKLSEMVGERVEIGRTGNYSTLREFQVKVPDFATHAVVDVAIGGAYLKGGPGSGSFGVTGFGSGSGNEATPWNVDASSNEFQRVPYIQAGRKVRISPDRRGTIQSVYVTARVAPSSSQGTIFGADALARAFLDIEWMQGVE